jgi:hypothetical protein
MKILDFEPTNIPVIFYIFFNLFALGAMFILLRKIKQNKGIWLVFLLPILAVIAFTIICTEYFVIESGILLICMFLGFIAGTIFILDWLYSYLGFGEIKENKIAMICLIGFTTIIGMFFIFFAALDMVF